MAKDFDVFLCVTGHSLITKRISIVLILVVKIIHLGITREILHCFALKVDQN